MSDNPVFGLVLSGGKSKRMGQDKALLERDGQSQLATMMTLLEPLVDRAFVSVREEQVDEPERQKFPQIVDRYDDMGPLAGMLTAMETHPDADWLVVACDLPNVGADTLQHLLANRSAEHPFTAYVSSHDGLPEPMCAIYRAGSADILRSFAGDGVHCPRKILLRSDTCLIQQLDPGSLDNVNTPADLANSLLEAAS